MTPLGGISPGMGGMKLDLLDGANRIGGAKPGGDTGGADKVGGSGAADFAAVLKDKLASLNASQNDAAVASQDMATGRVDDIAQTMLRIEQANVSLQMATQVRNKVLEAYQEVLRMQM